MPPPGVPRNRFGETPTRFKRGPTRSVNEHGETPDRFDDAPHVVVPRAGETPGLMQLDTRADVQAFGTIRRLWRQAIGGIPAPPPFEWSRQPAIFSRALRYKASSLYAAAGSDNTRFGAPRLVVAHSTASAPVTIGAGQKQNRPTVRNRLTSFGSRVPPINPRSAAAAADTVDASAA